MGMRGSLLGGRQGTVLAFDVTESEFVLKLGLPKEGNTTKTLWRAGEGWEAIQVVDGVGPMVEQQASEQHP
jgi:hypothetical protein